MSEHGQKRNRWKLLAVAVGGMALLLSASLLFWPRSGPPSQGPTVASEPRAGPQQGRSDRLDASRPPSTERGAEDPRTDPEALKRMLAEALLAAQAARLDESTPQEDASAAEGYRALLSEVISAIRRLELTPAQRHEAIAAALESSGPSQEPWTRASAEAFSSWEALMPPSIVPSASTPRCFRAGCLLPVSYSSWEEYEEAAKTFRLIHDPSPDHGGRILLPPRPKPDGSVDSGWIMLPPRPSAS